jgi:hypothetical protein
MAQATYRARIIVAWWLKPYLYGVILTASLTGMQPDEDKAGRWIARGMKLVIEAE